MQSRTVQQCIVNLNKLGEHNRITVAWTPGHTGVQGNEEADRLAKLGSKLDIQGPEPILPVPYASCIQEIRNWTLKRWKTSWTNRGDCRRTKEVVSWVTPSLTVKLLSLSRSQLHLIMQMLTGHCNLQKHKKTTGRAADSCCPKCGKEDETPDHHIGQCVSYQNIRKECFGNITVSMKTVMANKNIKTLAKYLKQAGRLSEY